MNTYIIGHIKPDLDSVVSALALEYLYQNVDCFGYTNPKAVIASPINNETKFAFKKFGVQVPPLLDEARERFSEPNSNFVLVDHNEESQRAEDIDPNQIVEIIDPHKPNLDLKNPIFLTLKPWGATTTIIWWLMQQNQIIPPQKLAQLMLCAVLSDTVGLKSATTTNKDKEAVNDLAKISEITDIDALTLEIFRAKSDIDALTPDQIVTNDYKTFNFGDKKVLIGQIETVEQDKILAQKENLVTAMRIVKTREKVDHIFLAISDILQINTKLLFTDEKEQQIAESAFDSKITEEHLLDIGPKLSRKNEIAPEIEGVLTQ